MNKMNIFANIENCDILRFLDKRKFNLINAPTVSHQFGSTCYTGLFNSSIPEDALLIYTNNYYLSEKHHTLSQYLASRFINQGRLRKSSMMLNLRAMGIRTPHFVYHNDSEVLTHKNIVQEVISMANILRNDEWSGKVVAKTEYGARGIGQLIFDPNNTYTIFDILGLDIPFVDKVKKLEELGVELPGIYHSDEEKENHILKLFKEENEFTIQEYIPDIDKEYRILFFQNGARYLFERDIKHVKETCPRGVEYLFVNEFITDLNLTNVVDKLESLFVETKYLFMSADIYVTKSGEIGCFEYSNQFAITNSTRIHEVVKSVNETVERYYNENVIARSC